MAPTKRTGDSHINLGHISVGKVRPFALGLMAAASPLALSQAMAQITTTGETDTTVTPGGGGSSATITTKTVNNGTGFNSFSGFTVGQGFTVNMVVPTDATRLVNVVKGQAVSINGIVNSYKGAVADTARGGDIYFVAPRGFVIGAGGVVNVGSLTVTTPSDSDADGILTNRLVPGTGGAMSDTAAITIAGQVNAIDSVRLASKTVQVGAGGRINTGVAALEALDAQNAQIFKAVVNDQKLEQAGAIVYRGGAIEIIGESEVGISGTLNARAGATADAGSISLKSATAVTVAQGGSVIADRKTGSLAGTVTIAADKSDTAFAGKTTALTSVDIGGTVKGGTVDVSTTSSAVTSYKDDKAAFATLTLQSGLTGLNAGYQEAESRAVITIGGTARMTAADNLTIAAKSTATTEMPVVVASAVSPVQAAVLASFLTSDAKVNVTGAAALTAGNTLALTADNTTKLSVSAIALNTSQVKSEIGAAAIGYGSVTNRTQAQVGADATIDAAKVEVRARNTNSLSVSAMSMASKDGYAGAGIAISEQDIETKAAFDAALARTVNGKAGKASGLVVTALTDTLENKTSGATAVGSAIAGKILSAATNAPSAIFGKVKGYFSSSAPGLEAATQNGDSNRHFRLGGGLSIANDKQVTTATVGAANRRIAVDGDVIVAAKTQDFGLRNIAQAEVASNDDATKDNGATTVGISAGVAYARHDHTTLATVAEGAEIVAGRLAVGADTIIPAPVTWLDWGTPTKVIGHLNGNLGIAGKVASSFTQAGTSAEDLGVAGSVNLNILTGETRAWIGENAKVTVGAAGNGFADDIGIDWSRVAGKALAVKALTGLEGIHIGGQFSLLLGGNASGSQGQGKSVGGSYTGPVQEAVTIAGIGAGTTVTAAGGLGVDAKTDSRMIVVAPSAGKGLGVGVVGMVNNLTIDNQTKAVISNQARIDAASVDVKALQDLMVVNVAAPIPVKAEGSGVGVGVAINTVSTDTVAGIVDTTAITKAGPTTLPANWAGYVNTSNLAVDAANTGWLTAFGIAGAEVDNDPDRTPLTSKISGKLKKGEDSDTGFLQKLQSGIASFIPDKPTPAAGGSKAKYSLAGAGSAAVNLSEMKARATITDATIGRYANSGAAKVSVTASNTPITMAGAGAGAKVSADGAKSVGIGGAVALDQSSNDAIATIVNSKLADVDDVTVRALNGGARAALGLAVALNTPPDEQKPGEAAASVSASLILNNDVAQAHIDDSTITGVAGGSDRRVDVTAYNAAKMGAGGGAGYEGGKFGLGLAVTAVVLGDDGTQAATEALIRDSKITQVDAVGVSAADPSIVLALAASGGRGAASVGVAGAGSHIDSSRTTRAGIGGIDGRSTVNATGAVKVTATATKDAALEALAFGRGTDLALDTGYDFSGASTIGDLRGQDDTALTTSGGQSLVQASGKGGLMIAAGGSGQSSGVAGKDAKANIGVSYSGILISDTREAFVDSATVTADALNVSAKDDAVRVGLAIGGSSGAEFGANGSIAFVEDKGGTKVRIGTTTGGRTTIDAGDVTAIADDASVVAALSGNYTMGGKLALGMSVTHIATAKQVRSAIDNSDIRASRRVAAEALLSGAVFDLSFAGAQRVTPGGGGDVGGGVDQVGDVAQGDGGGGGAGSGGGAGGGGGGAGGAGGGSAASGIAIGGASTSNILNASARATIANSTIGALNGARPDVAVRGLDSQFVVAAAIGFGIGGKGNGGIALVTNRRGGDEDGYRTLAQVSGGTMDVANLVLDSKASADIKSLAVGAAVGGSFAAGGSVVTNIVDGDVAAIVNNGANLTAQNNAAVAARALDRLDVIAGGVGFGKKGAGVGISIVTNVLNANTTAAVEGSTTRLSALGKSATGTTVYQGAMDATPDLTAIGEDQAGLIKTLGVKTVAVTGVAVNASSLNNINIAALSVGAGSKAGVGGNVATTVTGGATEARIVGATINSASGADARQQIDIAASDHAMLNSLVGAVGVSSKAGIAGGLTFASMNHATRAYASGATLSSLGASRVAAFSSQYTFGLNLGVGVGKAGIAGAVSVTRFDAETEAYVDGGTVTADTLDVTALNKTGSTIATGVVGIGTVGIGGGVSVITSDNATLAAIGASDVTDTSLTATTVKANAVQVAADRTADLNLYAVGAGIGKVGVAAMGNVLITNDRTKAGLFGGSVRDRAGTGDATSLSVHAGETVDAMLSTGAAAGGIVGVAGAVGVALSSNTVEATLDQTETHAATQTVEALANRDFHAITVSAGAGKVGVAASIGIIKVGTNGLDANVDGAGDTLAMVDTLGSDASDPDIDGLLTAQERGQLSTSSKIDATGAMSGAPVTSGVAARVLASKVYGGLTVKADDTTATRQDAGSLAGGAVGVGAGVAVTDVRNQVTAAVDGASRIEGPGLSVLANAQGAAVDNHAYVGAAGAVGVGAGVAVGTVANTVVASAGGTMKGTGSTADLIIDARDETSLASEIVNVVAGGGAVGATVSMLNKDSSVSARTLSDTRTQTSGYRNVAITAAGLGKIAASGIGASGGAGVSAQGAYVEAWDSVKVTAELGSGDYGYGEGGIAVAAVRTPEASANVLGISVSMLVGLGASVAKVVVDDDVTARTADNVTLSTSAITSGGTTRALASDLSVSARMTKGTGDTARATSQSGSGGGLIGADASVATASNTSNILAQTGNGLKMGYGGLSVFADRQSSQVADGTGVSVGGALALGAVLAETRAGGSIIATMASGLTALDGSGAVIGDLSIAASGKDDLSSKGIAGSGGVVAGAAAVAKTTHDTAILANVADSAIARPITAATFTLLGNYAADTLANANTVQASVLGGSGADARRTVDTSVHALVGEKTSIQTLNATIAAYQMTTMNGGGVQAASGGLLNGAAGVSQSWITPETKVAFGKGATLAVLGMAGANPGRLSIQSANTVNASDAATLDVGSAIPIAEALTRITSDTTNSVDIGEQVALSAVGQIDIGAYSVNAVRTDAKISTYGAVGSAGGDSEALISAKHNVTIGTGASVRGGDRVNIAAGASGTGIDATLSAAAVNDTYNWTAGPVNTRPDVKARADVTSNLTIASGATVESYRDVNLIASEGTRNATSDGTGHNPYLEVFSTTVDRSDQSDSGTGTINLAGSVAAGIRAKQTVTIGADGTVTKGATSGDIEVQRSVYQVRSALQAKVDTLEAIDQSGMTPEQKASLAGELAVFRQLLADAPPEPLTAAQRTAAQGRRADLVTQRAAVETNAPQAYGEDGTLTRLTDAQVKDMLAGIDAEISGLDTQLAATNFPTVYGYQVGNIYAAAGDVSIKANSLTGKGSVKAEGGATISIVNNSRDYLIANNLYIPIAENGGGHIRLSGGATAGSVTVQEIAKDQLPSITVTNAATSGKAGIFLQGAISNLGGAIDVTNQTGSIAQFAPVEGRTLSITAPNGSYAVNVPGQLYNLGSAPEAVWRPFMLLPASAQDGAFMVANYLYNRNADGSQKYSNGEQFTRSMLDISCGDRCLSPILFYDMINRKNVDDGQFRWAYNGNGGSFFSMMVVPVYSLTKSFTSYQPVLDPSDGIRARTLIVNAGTINITAPARIGRNNNYSLAVADTLDTDIAAIRRVAASRGRVLTGTISLDTLAADYGSLGAGVFIDNLLGRTSVANVGARSLSTPRNGDEKIALSYDFDNNRLVMPDVDGAGGGSIRLTGRIFSTSTYGALQVNSGFGDIKVVNNSTAGLQLGDIDTGRGALGKIQITDLAKTGYGTKPLTTWYVFENATGRLSTYNNAASGADDYIGLTPVSSTLGRAATYDPAAGYRYQWTMSRTAQRTVVPGKYNDSFAVYRQGASDWTWAESDWEISGRGFLPGGAGKPVFEQNVTGYISGYDQTATGTYNLSFYTTDGSFSWGSGQHTKYVNAATTVQVFANASLKADNPIAIRFTGNAAAAVDIQSKGMVTLGGRISNPTGTTYVTALGNMGGVTGTSGAAIETGSLTLSGRSVGSTANPLSVVMNGLLNATATTGDLGLAINGAARIGTIAARGDVRLSATQGIVGSDTLASVTGRNIDLAATGGAITGVNGTALAIKATSSTINGNIVGGELSATARDGITLIQGAGDLRLRSVSSATGDVSIQATTGSISNAIAEFTVDEANQHRLANVWSELGLTDPASVQKAVAAFERDIRNQQGERARILNQMTVVDGKVVGIGNTTLSQAQNDAARAIYAGQAKAAGQLAAAPTDAQIIAYVQARYDAIEAYATRVFGTSRPTGFDSTDLSQTFAYTLDPASARYQELTRGVWSESQLAQSISGTALVPVDNTTILRQAPNIRGHDVTVRAKAGAVGQNLAPVEILATPGRVLTTAERATLAAAGPGDIRVEDVAGGGKKLIISQQRLVNVSATGNVTVEALRDLYLGSASSLSAANIRTAGNARINVAGSLTNAAVNGEAAIRAANLSLEASGGSIGSASKAMLVQVDNQLLSVRAGGDVRLAQASGDLKVGVGFANNLFSLTAAKGSILSAFGNSEEVRLQGGTIAFDARDAIGTDAGRLQIQVGAAGQLTLAGKSASIASPLAALTLGDLRLTDGARIDGRDLTFAGRFHGASLKSMAANGTITVSGPITTTHGIAMTARSLSLADGVAMTVSGTHPDTMTLTATGGDLIADAVQLTSTGDIVLNAAGRLRLGGVIKGDGLSLTGMGGTTVLNDTTLTAAGTTILRGFDASLGDGVVLSSDSWQTSLTGALTTGRAVAVTARTIAIDSNGVMIGADNRLIATDPLAVKSTGALSAGDGLRLTGSTVALDAAGSMTLGKSAVLRADRDLSLRSGGDLTLGDTAVLAAGTTLTGVAQGALALGDRADLLAGQALALTADRLTTGNAASIRNRAAGTMALSAGSGGMAIGEDGTIASQGDIALTSLSSLTLGDRATVTALGDLNANASTLITGDKTVITARAMTLDAIRMTLGAANALAATQGLTLASKGAVTAGSALRLTGGDVTVVTDGDLSLSHDTALHATNGLIVRSGHDLTVGAGAKLTAGGALAAIAAGRMAFADRTGMTSGGMTLTAGAGGLTFGADAIVASKGDAALTSAGGITLGDRFALTAAQRLALTSGDMLSAANALHLTAAGIDAASVGTLSLGDKADVRAAGDLTLGTDRDFVVGSNAVFTAGSALSGSAKGAMVYGERTAISSTGGLALGSGAGGMTVGADGTIASKSDVRLTSAGDMTLGDRVALTAVGDVKGSAVNALVFGMATVADAAGLTFDAGNIAFGEANTLTAAKRMSLTSGDALTVGKALHLRGADIAATSGGILSMGDGAEIRSADALELVSGGDVALGGRAVLVSAGALTGSAKGAWTFGDRADISAGGPLALTTGTGGMTFGAVSKLVSGGDVTLTSANGMALAEGFTLTTPGNLGVVAARQLAIGHGATIAGAAMTLDAGEIGVGDSANLMASQRLVLTSRDTLAAGNGLRLAGASIDLAAGGNLTLADAVEIRAVNAADMAAGGDVSLGRNAVLSTGQGLTGSAGGTMTYGDHALISTGGPLMLSTGPGGMTFGDSGAVASKGNVTLTSGNDLTLGSGFVLTTTGDFQVAAANALAFGDGATASGAALVLNAGSIAFGDGNTLTATRKLSLTGRHDLMAGEALHLTGAEIDAQSGGDISLGNDSEIRAAGGLNLVSGGNLSAGDRASLAVATSLNASARGAMTFGDRASVTSGSAMTFEAGTGGMRFGTDGALSSKAGVVLASRDGMALDDRFAIAAAGDVRASAAKALTLGEGVVVTADALAFDAGTIVFGDDSRLTAANALSLSGGDSVIAGKSLYLAGAGIGVKSGGVLTLGDGAALRASGDVSLGSGNSLSVGDQAVLAAGGALNVNAGGDVVFGNGARLTSGDALELSGNNLSVGADSAVVALGDVGFSATGGVMLGNRFVVSSGKGLRMIAGEALTIGDDGQATTDSLAFDAGSITIGARNIWAAAQQLSLASRGVMSAGADLHLIGADVGVSTGDTLSLGNGAMMAASNGLSLTSWGDVVVGDGATFAAGTTLTAAADGAIAIGGHADLAAGGDLTLSGGSMAIGFDGRLASQGNVAVTSRTGLVLGERAAIGGTDVVLQATGGNLAAGSKALIAARRDLTLAASSDVTLGNGLAMTAGRSLVSTAGGALTIGSAATVVAVGGNVALTSASGDLGIGANSRLTAASLMMLKSAKDLTLGDGSDLSSGDSLSATAVGGVAIGAGATLRNTVGGDVLVQAGDGGIAIGADSAITALGGIGLASPGAMTLGDRVALTAAESLSAGVGGTLSIGNGAALSVAGPLSMTARRLAWGDAVTMRNLGQGGIALVAGGDGLSGGTNTRLVAAGDLTLTSGDAMMFGDGLVLDAGGLVAGQATGSFSIGNGATMTSGHDLSVTAASVTIGNGLTATAAQRLAMMAGGALTLGNQASLSGAEIALRAASVTGGDTLTIKAREAVAITADGGGISLGRGASLAAGTDVAIEAVDTVALAGLDSSSTRLRIAGTQVALGEESRIVARDTADLRASQGAMTAAKTRINAAALLLKASGDVGLSDSSLTSTTTAIAAGRDIALARTAIGTTSLALTADRDLSVDGGTFRVDADTGLTAGRGLSIAGGAVLSSETQHLSAVMIALDTARIEAKRTVTLSATGGISATSGSALKSGTSTTLDADTIALAQGTRIDAGSTTALRSGKTLGADGVITAGEAVTLDAGGLLRVAEASAGTAIVVRSGGDARIGRLAAGASQAEAIRVSSAGAVDALPDAPMNLVAKTGGIVLAAQNGIGQSAPIRTDARNIAFQTAASGADIRSIGPVTLTGSADRGIVRFTATDTTTVRDLTAMTVDLASDGKLDWTRGRFAAGTIAARGGVTATGLEVGSVLNILAPRMEVAATGTGNAPLTITASGSTAGTLADWAAFRIAAPTRIVFDQLHAVDGRIQATTPDFAIRDGVVGHRIDVTLPDVTMLLTRVRTAGEGVTIQARAATGGYSLDVKGRQVLIDAAVMGGRATRADGGFIDPSMLTQPDAVLETAKARQRATAARVRAEADRPALPNATGPTERPMVNLPPEAESQYDTALSIVAAN